MTETRHRRQFHFTRKDELRDQLDAIEAAGDLRDGTPPWTEDEDDVLLSVPESVQALAVALKRSPASVRARRAELYVIDHPARLRALSGRTLAVLDAHDEVRAIGDVDNIVLPAAVIMGRPKSTVAELKAAARSLLDDYYDRMTEERP